MYVGSSSPTRDWTQAPCIGSLESYPLHHQGSPWKSSSYCWKENKRQKCLLFLHWTLLHVMPWAQECDPEDGSLLRIGWWAWDVREERKKPGYLMMLWRHWISQSCDFWHFRLVWLIEPMELCGFPFLKIYNPGTSVVVQWLRLCTPNAGGPSSIAGQGTRSHMLQLRVCMLQLKIPHAATKDSACHT